MKILVLGGSGHLGHSTLLAGLEKKVQVSATFRDLKWTQHPQIKNLNCSWHKADLLDIQSLRQAMRGQDIVLHMAAPSTWSAKNSEQMYSLHIEGTKNVFQAAADSGVRRIVMTSSCSAIGLQAGSKVLTEEIWNENLHSPLLKGKMLAEQWAWNNHNRLGLELFTLCLPSLIGPHFLQNYAHAQLIRSLQRRFLPPLPRVGFHFLDVRDAAEAHLLAAECGLSSQRYIVAGDFVDNASLAKTARQIDPKTLCTEKALPFGLLRGFSFLDRWNLLKDFKDLDQRVSSQKIRQQLGWSSRPLMQSLKDSLSWQAFQDQQGSW